VRLSIQLHRQPVEPYRAVSSMKRAKIDVGGVACNWEVDLITGPIARAIDVAILHVVEGQNSGPAVYAPPKSRIALRDAGCFDVAAVSHAFAASILPRKRSRSDAEVCTARSHEAVG